MTQVYFSKARKITAEIKRVAQEEGLVPEIIRRRLAEGSVVIPINLSRRKNRQLHICGIGKGLRTKVNANIGTSPVCTSIEKELDKLFTAIKAGTDTVMDLSTGGDIKKIRRAILKNSTVPVGTVPIYQAVCEIISKKKTVTQLTPEHIFAVIEEQCADGVDFITVHCGITLKNVELLKKQKRLCGVVSRGGAFLIEWIIGNNKENPLYSQFDRLLDIAYKYDVMLSLGDGLRPGAISDASDKPQMGELSVLGELVLCSRKRNVQVIVEGPGHMPLNQITNHIKLQKKITHNAPYYLLGPLVTDIAAGFDHIAGAIGGAIAASAGADFLCYVTPAEHLRLPEKEDVYAGVIASRIAGHSADIVKGVQNAKEWDLEFSKARKKLNWVVQERLSLDKDRFRQLKQKVNSGNVCTMCGKYCAMRESSKVGI